MLLILATFAAIAASSDAKAVQITRVSSPVHFMEKAVSVYTGMYHAYRITNNDGVAYPNLYVRLQDIATDT